MLTQPNEHPDVSDLYKKFFPKRPVAELKGEEMCEHMLSLVEYCREHTVYFGGCGDCGSPWLTCRVCNLTIDEADEVFEDKSKLAFVDDDNI